MKLFIGSYKTYDEKKSVSILFEYNLRTAIRIFFVVHEAFSNNIIFQLLNYIILSNYLEFPNGRKRKFYQCI